MAVSTHITWEINHWPGDGRSSVTYSRPIDMNNDDNSNMETLLIEVNGILTIHHHHRPSILKLMSLKRMVRMKITEICIDA
jgi:hypothetical protein